MVISGLPGSGKSTVGRALARRLACPLIDKDDLLEALFDARGCDDLDQRALLSAEADEELLRRAAASPRAVLVNWWSRASTIDGLRRLPHVLREVWCECPPDLAVDRWYDRDRHPGHLDRLRAPEVRRVMVAALREAGDAPRGLSEPVLRVDTSGEFDPDGLIVALDLQGQISQTP